MILQRQAVSGLGIHRFCEREGIAADRFYWWRRTLGERDCCGSGPERGAGTSPIEDRHRHRRDTESPFVSLPLTVSLSAPIEIVHPRGHVVRLGAGFDDRVLDRILAMLDAPAISAQEA